jgi:hypothetical protein
LDAMEDREKKEAALAIEDPNHDRYGQDWFWNWLKCILEYILFPEFVPSRSCQKKRYL